MEVTGKNVVDEGMIGEKKVGLSKVVCVGEFVVGVGDDEGGVRLVDVREGLGLPSLVVVGKGDGGDGKDGDGGKGGVGKTCRKHVGGVLEQADYISGMVFVEGSNMLFASSGDGTVCLYDVRVPQVKLCLASVSEDVEDDLLCIDVINNSRRLVCGTMMGLLQVFTVDSFTASHDKVLEEDHVVKFAGHPGLVNAVREIEDNEGWVVTGSDDGLLRVVNLGARQSDQRNFQGVVGKVEGDVEAMNWVGGRKGLLAVACSDEMIHLIDLEDNEEDTTRTVGSEAANGKDAEEDPDNDSEDSRDGGGRRRKKKRRKRGNKDVSKSAARSNKGFFSDL